MSYRAVLHGEYTRDTTPSVVNNVTASGETQVRRETWLNRPKIPTIEQPKYDRVVSSHGISTKQTKFMIDYGFD